MAERRMFSKQIIDSDVFLDMPLSTQALYFHLSMRADDEGFVNNPKKVMRMISSTQNDFELLLAKRYIILFDSGVIVIKHWRMHNYIQKDRFKETVYIEERNQLILKDNKSYTEKQPIGNNLDTECIQDGYTGKVSIGEFSKGDKEKIKQKESFPNSQPFQKYIPPERDYPIEFESIRNNWNDSTGKDERKSLYQFSESRKIMDRMEPYSLDEIITAIQNFSKSKDFKKLNYSLPGFLETGVPNYLKAPSEKKPPQYEEIVL